MHTHSKQPLLTISIPTYNRSSFLEQNLKQLSKVADGLWDEIELIVSDNASTDNTQDVVEKAILRGVPVKYVRNTENIGSDLNIAQAFNLATGKYVVIMGDDDLFVEGALSILLDHLRKSDYGVVCLKPFGFDSDPNAEYPGFIGEIKVFSSPADFLVSIGQFITFISVCILNKSLLPDVDARQFVGGHLVQVHLVLSAALAAHKNLHFDKYLIAGKRNNSGGYDFSKVFVENLGVILDSYLDERTVHKIENKLIFSYFPYYVLRKRFENTTNLETMLFNFNSRFKNRPIYEFWLKPIMTFPKSLALLWGMLTTFIGRVLGGDFWRGCYFAYNKFKKLIMSKA